MITVKHVKDLVPGVYVGRGSPLGNPYHIGKDGTREEVIAKYSRWLAQEVRLGTVEWALEHLLELAEAGDLVLLCHCAPRPCHADVLKEVLEHALVKKQ